MLDYNYVDSQVEKPQGKKKFPGALKNQSSVGNPLSSKADEMQRPKTVAEPKTNFSKTTGSMHLAKFQPNSRF